MVKGLDAPGRKPVLEWRLRGISVPPDDVPDNVAQALVHNLRRDERLHALSNIELAGPGCRLWFRKQELGPDITEYILRYERGSADAPETWIMTVEVRNNKTGEVVVRESPQ